MAKPAHLAPCDGVLDWLPGLLEERHHPWLDSLHLLRASERRKLGRPRVPSLGLK